MEFKKLFSNGSIGRLRVKNRGIMAPMSTGFANHDGTPSPRMIRYYEERAMGGVGAIITEYMGVDDVDSVVSNHQLMAAQDFQISALEQLTEAVHRHDCLIFAQLHHGGNTANPTLSGRQPLSASDVPAAPGRTVPRPMTVEEIHTVVDKFIQAAERCKRAGYDGVEIHCAHSYLLGQFLSPYYNKRTDAYGGSLENRVRIVEEIIQGIRSRLGPVWPILVRMSGDELTPDVPGTLTLQDGLEIARRLEQTGIDALDISNGSSLNPNANCDPYSYPPGWKKHIAAAYKAAVGIPVIATNTIKTPEFAESLLEEEVCDFVGLGRSQFADPQFMNKARVGKSDQVRNCIGCMYCRERVVAHRLPAACAVNPLTGREYCLGELRENGNGRPVTVIGGGPSGMEAALVLAGRGFRVTLLERERQLGGTLLLAAQPPHKEGIGRLVSSMAAELEAAGVDVRLGVSATPEMAREQKAEAVFLAIGAEPVMPPISGLENEHVCSAEAVIRGDYRPAGNVVVVGSGMTGLETAELLGERGCRVTVVEMQDKIGPGLFSVILNDSLRRLSAYSTAYLPKHRLTAVFEDGVEVVSTEDGSTQTLEADYLVLALGVAPDQKLVDAYRRTCENLFVIGDADKAGRIAEATCSALDKASVALA